MTKFTWGDSVCVKADAPEQYQPGEGASVCGLAEIETDARAIKYDCPIGSMIYTIEFGAGSSIEVPERWPEHG